MSKFYKCPKCNSSKITINDAFSPYIECDDCSYGIYDFGTEEEIAEFIASDNKLSRIFDKNYKIKDEYKETKPKHVSYGGKRFAVDTKLATPFELYVHAAQNGADIYNQSICRDSMVWEYDHTYRDSIKVQKIVIHIDTLKHIIIANNGIFSDFIVMWRE